jgi:hypothetical protein
MCAELTSLSESQEATCGINMLGDENTSGLFSLMVVKVADRSYHWTVQRVRRAAQLALERLIRYVL